MKQCFQGEKRPDHIFTDSFFLSLACGSDLAMNIKTALSPAKDLSYKFKADKFFPKKQGEDLP